jgi:diguanylate cyclase (GGDEF)-like protein/PAS domain S-box-containing protein
MFQLNTISIILFATTLLNLIITYISWQRRRSLMGTYFALALSFTTLWTFASALDYASIPLSLKILFAKFEAIGYNFGIAFLFIFVLYYVGNENWLKNLFIKFLAYVLPITSILLIWTNEWHGWFWRDFTRVPGNENLVIFHHGPAYAYAYLSYISTLLAIGLLWKKSRQGSSIERQQALMLFTASCFPVIFNLIYQFGIFNTPGVDWTSVTFSLTGIFWLTALYRTRLLNLIPIARHTLIQRMNDIILVLDEENRLLDLNDPAVSIFGLDENSFGRNIQHMIPVLSNLEELNKLPPEKTTPFEFHLGQQVFDLRITFLTDPLNYVLGKILVFHEITHRHKMEQDLQERTQQLQLTVQKLEEEIKTREEIKLELRTLTRAVEQMASSVVITDDKANIEYVNPWTLELTGYELDEVIGQNPNIFQSKLTPEETYQDLWQTLSKGLEWRGTFVNKKKNGDVYWEHCIISPVRDAAGKTTHYVAVKEDITERIKMEKELEELATTDSLSNVANRRELTQLINQELARADRYNHTTSVIMLDIDHFKKVNDRYGHIAGDHVIQHTAKILSKNLRRTDRIGRYGGDEFIILLPETELSKAKSIAQKLRKKIEGARLKLDDKTIQITSSMGVSSIQSRKNKQAGTIPEFQHIISLADRALYQAKEDGRNCVR